MENSKGEEQNQNPIQTNSRNTYLVVGIVVILLIAYWLTRGRVETGNEAAKTNLPATSQEQQENAGEAAKPADEAVKASETDKDAAESAPAAMDKNTQPAGAMTKTAETAGSNSTLAVSGVLHRSTMPALGNYKVMGVFGTLYLKTKRDYSALVGQSVRLAAVGDIRSFHTASITTDTDLAAKGGLADAMDRPKVKFTGQLLGSNNATRGNYMVKNSSSFIYLRTKQDYTSLLGSEVTLTGYGSLQKFTGASLQKK